MSTSITPTPVTTTTTSEEKAIKRKPDPFIYILIFAILFLTILGLLTWVLDVYNKHQQCSVNPNIWCADTWSCSAACDNSSGVCMQNVIQTPGVTPGPVNPCFCSNATESTGLASCLFGPNAPAATTCINPGTDGETNVGTCTCPTGIQQTITNCFNNCYQSISDLADAQGSTPTVNCCCDKNAFPEGSNAYNFCANNPCTRQ